MKFIACALAISLVAYNALVFIIAGELEWSAYVFGLSMFVTPFVILLLMSLLGMGARGSQRLSIVGLIFVTAAVAICMVERSLLLASTVMFAWLIVSLAILLSRARHRAADVLRAIIKKHLSKDSKATKGHDASHKTSVRR